MIELGINYLFIQQQSFKYSSLPLRSSLEQSADRSLMQLFFPKLGCIRRKFDRLASAGNRHPSFALFTEWYKFSARFPNENRWRPSKDVHTVQWTHLLVCVFWNEVLCIKKMRELPSIFWQADDRLAARLFGKLCKWRTIEAARSFCSFCYVHPCESPCTSPYGSKCH